MLGAITEQVAGRSYFDYIQEHIFQAAGMANTGFYERDQQVPHRAIVYQGSAHLIANTSQLLPAGLPLSGSYATVDDLLKFANAPRGTSCCVQKPRRWCSAGRSTSRDEAGARVRRSCGPPYNAFS